jgi:2-octaprenyl-6-methoxyphenol hydroxylase
MLNSQKICIIGSGLTSSTLAYLLSDFKFQIDIFPDLIDKRKSSPSKIALSKNSLDKLEAAGLNNIRKKTNLVKNIYLYDSYSEINLKEDLGFSASPADKALAYIADSKILLVDINKKIKKKKNINFINKNILSIKDGEIFKEIIFKDSSKENYNLIILTSKNSLSLLPQKQTRKIFEKSYNEDAFVFNLFHAKINNNSARQFFLKDGPLAFLPVNNQQTSVIWSIKKNSFNRKYVSNKKYLLSFFNENFRELFKEIISVTDIGTFNLEFFFNELKVLKRTLLVGDISAKIHPIAGQGWNMNLRNIFSLIETVKDFRNLGFDIGNDIFIRKYLERISLNHFGFTALIDGIRKIFDIKVDDYAAIRKNALSIINKNNFIKSNLTKVADKGLFI